MRSFAACRASSGRPNPNSTASIFCRDATVLMNGIEPPDGSRTGARPNTSQHADRTARTNGECLFRVYGGQCLRKTSVLRTAGGIRCARCRRSSCAMCGI
jgi:hypothetical protein